MRDPRERLWDVPEATGHIERYRRRGRKAFEIDEVIEPRRPESFYLARGPWNPRGTIRWFVILGRCNSLKLCILRFRSTLFCDHFGRFPGFLTLVLNHRPRQYPHQVNCVY